MRITEKEFLEFLEINQKAQSELQFKEKQKLRTKKINKLKRKINK